MIRRRLGVWLRVVTGLVVGGILACVTIEAVLRIEAKGWSRAALSAWEERRPWEAIRRPGPDGEPRPVPGGHASWRIQPWAQPIEYRLDRNGFRAVPAPSTAACRVLGLGDSHTFGYGVGADLAWPAVLERMLVGVRVANAGLCGTGIAAAQAWLPEALDAAHPQVVVLAVTPWSLREDPEPPEQHELDARWPRVEAYLRRVTRVSAVADRASRYVLQRSAAVFGWPPPAPVLWELAPLLESRTQFHVRWRGVDARLADMVRLVRRRGAIPIVLFIPLDVQVSAERNVLYRMGRLPYRTHGFVDRDYTHDDRYVRALDKTVERLNVTFVDATPMLRAVASSGFLRDSYHLAPEGHAHLAALMAATIAKACGEAAVVEAGWNEPIPTAEPGLAGYARP